MKLLNRLIPQSMAGQMIAVLATSFLLLLAVLAIFELREFDSLIETTESELTTDRLNRIAPLIGSIRDSELDGFMARVSRCHEGYLLSDTPYGPTRTTPQTDDVVARISETLGVDRQNIRVGLATFRSDDFSYRECPESDMEFPLEGAVVSLRVAPNQWLNAEIHPHEWHLTPTMSDWLIRSGAAFLLIGGVALFFVFRLGRPFKKLTDASEAFASGFEVTELEESGPPDIRRAINAFNTMQREVRGEMERRSSTLAAISHDIRTPLTALRVKAELIEDEAVRADHIVSIEKMERITASALAFLKGESRNEPKRTVDLGELIESECIDFSEAGADVSFVREGIVHYYCRPEALARAIRNLVENAIKYAGHARVSLNESRDEFEIAVADAGPGIPLSKMSDAIKPFERTFAARDSDTGGFGLGLAIAKAVADGHDGALILEANTPSGLIAKLKLPK